MAKRIKLVDRMNTTPISNIIPFDRWHSLVDFFHQSVRSKRAANSLSLVDYHVKFLGHWNYIFRNEYAFKVWEFPGWRIFVANGYGVSFEVMHDTSAEEAEKYWKDYLEKLDIPFWQC